MISPVAQLIEVIEKQELHFMYWHVQTIVIYLKAVCICFFLA